jgi:hypothetical protein
VVVRTRDKCGAFSRAWNRVRVFALPGFVSSNITCRFPFYPILPFAVSYVPTNLLSPLPRTLPLSRRREDDCTVEIGRARVRGDSTASPRSNLTHRLRIPMISHSPILKVQLFLPYANIPRYPATNESKPFNKLFCDQGLVMDHRSTELAHKYHQIIFNTLILITPCGICWGVHVDCTPSHIQS